MRSSRQPSTRKFHKLVAQIFNLPYRRLAACAGSPSLNRPERSTPCRPQVGDTAPRGRAAAKTARGRPGRRGAERPRRPKISEPHLPCAAAVAWKAARRKNRRGLRRFHAILIDFKSALRSLRGAWARRTRETPSLPTSTCLTWTLASSAALVTFGQDGTDTRSSPHAQVRPVALNEVRWTRGFWADRFELCRRRMIPGMWALMEGTNYSHYYQNFRIAAGLAPGRHRGAQFNDGDFYKWIEAASVVLAAKPDAELEQQLEEIIGVMARAQRADGYIHTPVIIRQRNGDTQAKPFESPLNFETYNLGHLLTAASAHYRATGRTNFLTLARKAADFLDEAFRQPTPELARCSICPSHYMGIVALYRATRESRYLELAKKFFAMRDLITGGGDDNQDRVPFRQQTNAMGHAVRANYLYAGAADLFAETGEPALWTPLQWIWTNVVRQKMYITGGCGALYDGASPDGARDQRSITRVHQAYGRNYQLPNLAAHNETCANIGNVLWNWRMFLATGEARFMDVVELALYNSVLAGVGLDGTNFFYVNPLRQLDTLPAELRWSRARVPYVSSFCCPPNLVRTVAQTGGYAYSKSADAIGINLYGGSTLTTQLPDGQLVKLTQETEYPWNGRVRLSVMECGEKAFALKLRIPGWAKSATVRLNHAPLELSTIPASYLELRRVWRAGDVVELDLPMPVQWIEANPLVEEALNQVAIKRGPLVYCLESTDLPRGVRLLDVTIPWNIDLVPRYDGHLLGGMVVIEGNALARPQDGWGSELYREFSSKPAQTVEARFIPYFTWGNRGKSEMSVWLPR
ncbi:MAG: glycoside hydrolase family 127 protein [Verrucomicrobia bacterium]|nr:glycoside hydrolase family 127 protein [Verrucomicrobiota bacterium]